MAGDQPSDDRDAADGAPPVPGTDPDDDAPQLPTDPIDPAATPLPAGTPALPPVVPPAPPPATVAATAPVASATGHADPALDEAPAIAEPAAGAASPPSPPSPPSPADDDASGADGDLTGNPGHTIRTLAIAIVALVVLLGVGLLAIQKFGRDPAPRPNTDGAAASPQAPASPSASPLTDITVTAILLNSSDDSSPCPGIARLMGTITVAGGATDVTYRWTHSDGRDSDIRTVRVDGSAQVVQDWEHPGRTSFLGQTQLEVIAPTAARSATLNFRGSCAPSSGAVSPSPSVSASR
jgi:hypothetical protein